MKPSRISCLVGACVMLALLCDAHVSHAGDTLTLAEKFFAADTIIEIEVRFDKPVPKRWLERADHSFPGGLAERAGRRARLRRVIMARAGQEPEMPEHRTPFSLGSRCWWNAHARKRIRVLLFMRDGHKVYGVEVDKGVDTDMHPDYRKRLAAIETAMTWPDKPAAKDVTTIRQTLDSTKNPYVIEMALHYLQEHAPDAVADWASGDWSERTERLRKRIWSRTRDLRCQKPRAQPRT